MFFNKKNLVVLSVILFIAVFSSCVSVNQKAALKTGDADFTLQLLHFGDINNNEDVALSSLDEFSSILNAFKSDEKYASSTLVVSSGNNIIPGQRYYAAEQPEIQAVTGSNEAGSFDIALLNAFGTKASALGIHELDAGPKEFFDSIKPKSFNGVNFPGAEFPYLVSNMDFSLEKSAQDFIGQNGSACSELAGKIAPSAIVELNGEKIGIVGASTPLLGTISDLGKIKMLPEQTMNFGKLAAIIQESVDSLTNSGVNKIILLAHIELHDIEEKLARQLKDVDIIVAGGSNSPMGDSDDIPFSPKDKFTHDYLSLTSTKNNKPLAIVNVEGDYKYLGRLVVDFDKNGELLLGNLDSKINGAWASIPQNVKRLNATPIDEVVKLQDAMVGLIKKNFGNVVGYSSVYLDGRRSQIRTEETNFGNLTADANLWYANLMAKEPVDISFKNGGGVRAEIGTTLVRTETRNIPTITYKPPKNGLVTEGDIKASLPWDNGLVTATLTASELKMIIEHGIASSGPGNFPGAFPQIAGAYFVFDETKAKGSRLVTLNLVDKSGNVKDVIVENGKIKGDPKRTFRIVTLNYLFDGGDDYPFNKLSNPERRNLYASDDCLTEYLDKDPGKNNSFSKTGFEQDALAEYMLEFHGSPETTFSKPESLREKDIRIKRL